MLSPYKIRWHNMSSLDFDLWTEISFDGDNGDVETHLSREAVISESYNGSFKRAYGYRWDESLIFSVTFIKKDYYERYYSTYEEKHPCNDDVRHTCILQQRG